MTVISDTNKQAIKGFVQGVLGCKCPSEVFLSINVEKNPTNFADLSQGDLIAIGGKLLVFLIKTDNGEILASKLEQIFNRGREIRDKGGFHRFRLVISAPVKQPAEEILTRQFEILENPGERLHLHVIVTDQLPDLSAQ